MTVIIPVHKFDSTVQKYLERALASIPNGIKVSIASPELVCGSLAPYINDRVNVIACGDKTSFQALVNCAVEHLDGTEWFSILEFDDEYTPYWFDEVENYIKAYPSTSVFMPLTDIMREEDGKTVFVGYGNEAPLASAFSNELGFIDSEVLENYFDFYMTGSVFNVHDYTISGGLKESMKLTFWYEFMLRMTHKDKKFQVIPKVGYRHLVDRKDSLYEEYKNTLTSEEQEWWFSLAKEEYRYTKDRNKQYSKTEGED